MLEQERCETTLPASLSELVHFPGARRQNLINGAKWEKKSFTLVLLLLVPAPNFLIKAAVRWACSGASGDLRCPQRPVRGFR